MTFSSFISQLAEFYIPNHEMDNPLFESSILWEIKSNFPHGIGVDYENRRHLGIHGHHALDFIFPDSRTCHIALDLTKYSSDAPVSPP